MNNPTSITLNFPDGTTAVYTPEAVLPTPDPIVKVEVVTESGIDTTFVPQISQ